MGDLIVGVIMDILIHVSIQYFHGAGIGWIPCPTRDFAVLDAGELVVLHPQIGFDEFCCRQKSKNVKISLRGSVLLRSRRGGISQQSGADSSCSNSK